MYTRAKPSGSAGNVAQVEEVPETPLELEAKARHSVEALIAATAAGAARGGVRGVIGKSTPAVCPASGYSERK